RDLLRSRRGQRGQPMSPPTSTVSAGSSETSPQAREGAAFEVTGVSKSFGGVAALRDVDLSVDAGALHGLIGPNGSGKTTLLNVVSGFLAQDSGTVTIGGVDRSGARPHQLAKAGVARTFQTPQLVPELSVLDNVRI